MIKQRIKTITTICMVFLMLITLTACTSKEAKSVIKKIDSIGEITENSGEILKQIQSEYSKLTEEQKAEVDNYDQYIEAKKDFDILIFSSIKREVEKAQLLEKRYFSKYYDLNNLHKAKTEAEQALENSNVDIYSDVFFELKKHNEDLSSYIDAEIKKLYNVQTQDNGNNEYPFAVNIDLNSIEWDAEPLRKQNSKHPTWIIGKEPETTDKPAYVCLFIDGSSGEYSTKIEQIAEKEITVEDENGEMQKAVVNTQITFSHMEGGDDYISLNERPAYLFKDKSENVVLALKNYDNKDYYVLYTWAETTFE